MYDLLKICSVDANRGPEHRHNNFRAVGLASVRRSKCSTGHNVPNSSNNGLNNMRWVVSEWGGLEELNLMRHDAWLARLRLYTVKPSWSNIDLSSVGLSLPVHVPVSLSHCSPAAIVYSVSVHLLPPFGLLYWLRPYRRACIKSKSKLYQINKNKIIIRHMLKSPELSLTLIE